MTWTKKECNIADSCQPCRRSVRWFSISVSKGARNRRGGARQWIRNEAEWPTGRRREGTCCILRTPQGDSCFEQLARDPIEQIELLLCLVVRPMSRVSRVFMNMRGWRNCSVGNLTPIKRVGLLETETVPHSRRAESWESHWLSRAWWMLLSDPVISE